jgi:hypothetical protein
MKMDNAKETERIMKDLDRAKAYREGYEAAANRYMWYSIISFWFAAIGGFALAYIIFG